MKNEMDVVIISYAKNQECYDLTKKCLDSLITSEEDVKFNVFVVESEPGINWDHIDSSIKTYPAPLPYGYHKFLNFGRKLGSAEFVALCNNDLIFYPKWASKIFQASDYNPDYLSFCPICPKTQTKLGISINSPLIKGYNVRVHISGWCIVQKRSIYNIIGDLDENFIHWWSDNDYAETIKSKGVKHMLVPSSVVEHHENTIGVVTTEVVLDENELASLTYGAKAIFDKKWRNRNLL